MTDRNKSSFALHQFGTILIFQATEDVKLKDGRIIPKGYVNATQMCVNNYDYLRITDLLLVEYVLQKLEENPLKIETEDSIFIDMLAICC